MNYHLNLTVEVICVLAAMSDVPSYPDILTLNPNTILMPLSIGIPELAVRTRDVSDIMNQCQLYALIVANIRA